MFRDLSARSTEVIRQASAEARALNHEYVGTEHLLLALVLEESGVAAGILNSLGVTVGEVRDGLESLVERGPESVSSRELPLTPRSNHVLELAREEASSVNQKSVDTEHLLLALLLEVDGVASQVLQNLGVKPSELRDKALKARVALMKIVERSVRPVQASTVRKRKVREELFVHVTQIYEEELARLNDPDAALAQAALRFGEPAELARELDGSLPYYERFTAFIERWVQYRAPESVARYSFRLATHTFWLLALVLGLVTGGLFLRYGWIEAVQTTARVLVAIALLTPPLQFVVTLALVKMRDAMWGAFGSRKSWGRVLTFYVVLAMAAEFYLMGVAAVARWDFNAAIEAARLGGTIGVISAIAFVAIAYLTGPATIRDTQWALWTSNRLKITGSELATVRVKNGWESIQSFIRRSFS